MNIDLDAKITEHFIWREALLLSRWHIYAFPDSITHKQNIYDTCLVLEEIRSILQSPLKVTSFYRPRKYNHEIGGALESLHMQGLACDFIPTKVPVQKAKLALVDFLEELDCRMEDNGKGGWIHIDLGKPGYSGRFFKP